MSTQLTGSVGEFKLVGFRKQCLLHLRQICLQTRNSLHHTLPSSRNFDDVVMKLVENLSCEPENRIYFNSCSLLLLL